MEREKIVKFLDLLKENRDKHTKLTEALEEFSGDCIYIPDMSPEVEAAIDILWEEVFQDTSFDGCNWLEWHMFENDFGKEEKSAYMDDVEYKITSNEDMADFLIERQEYCENDATKETESSDKEEIVDLLKNLCKTIDEKVLTDKNKKAVKNVVNDVANIASKAANKVYTEIKDQWEDFNRNAYEERTIKFDAIKIYNFCHGANFSKSRVEASIDADDNIIMSKSSNGGRCVIVVTNCNDNDAIGDYMETYHPNALTKICILVSDNKDDKLAIRKFFDSVINFKETYSSKQEYQNELERLGKLVNCW